MISSMTGYGMAQNADFRVEVRSVNHRHLDVQVRMPVALFPHEQRLKERVRQRVKRGRVDVHVAPVGAGRARIGVNREAARAVVSGLREIQSELGLPGDVTVDALSRIRDVFEPESAEETDFERVAAPLDEALDGLLAMRADEGRALQEDVSARLDEIEARFRAIRPLAEAHRDRIEAELRERLQAWREGLEVDEARLLQEVFFYVDKADITEELVRADSHIAQARRFLADGGVVGRKLDFLSQEILREANTVASKAGRSEIAHLVVEIKDQIEKVREQVQNIQ